MNVVLDDLVQRVACDPDFRQAANEAPAATAERAGVSLSELSAVLRGDLIALHECGVHPLLIMQLAGALGVDPMRTLTEPT